MTVYFNHQCSVQYHKGISLKRCTYHNSLDTPGRLAGPGGEGVPGGRWGTVGGPAWGLVGSLVVHQGSSRRAAVGGVTGRTVRGGRGGRSEGSGARGRRLRSGSARGSGKSPSLALPPDRCWLASFSAAPRPFPLPFEPGWAAWKAGLG